MSSKQKTNDPHRDLDTMSGAATDLFNRLPLTLKSCLGIPSSCLSF